MEDSSMTMDRLGDGGSIVEAVPTTAADVEQSKCEEEVPVKKRRLDVCVSAEDESLLSLSVAECGENSSPVSSCYSRSAVVKSFLPERNQVGDAVAEQTSGLQVANPLDALMPASETTTAEEAPASIAEADDDDDDDEDYSESVYIGKDFTVDDFNEDVANEDDGGGSRGEDNGTNDAGDDNGGGSSSTEEDGQWPSDDEVPPDEIYALLEQKYDEYSKAAKQQTKVSSSDEGEEEEEEEEDGEEDMAHEERRKIVLRVRGRDHFEILPESWIEVTHNSGMPIYLHKQSRVCTLSKPYFLGPGSARKHDVPISAIPCFHYRREVEKESGKQESQQSASVEGGQSAGDSVNGTAVPIIMNNSSSSQVSSANPKMNRLPRAKVETLQEYTKEKSINSLELREYCQRLFEFQTITPVGTKLITCPLPPSNDKDGAVPNTRREFIMNPHGKSYVCILHEYVQHAMRCQPRYVFNELENASAPYGATVLINEMLYGSGFGCSKKIAKTEAAKATLEILIPQMKTITSQDKHSANDQQDMTFFDSIRVEDPRVSELCAKAGQPSPYQLLLDCLKRNYGMGDTHIKLDMHMLRHQKNEFTMVVGKHVATVVCKNKRDGKQKASQAILQALHSHITSWGSLLRLYGKGSCRTPKEKKLEEQQITELQSRTTANKPNLSILNKLKEEMLKLKAKREQEKVVIEPLSIDPLPVAASNLKNLDL